jgi:succinate dehydrogenase/fumarate reductase cytochrome b subunit
MLTGFPCPGCGITKSIVYFYDGNIYKSLLHHLFGPFIVLLCLFLLVKFTLEIIKNKTYTNISYDSRKKIAYAIAITLAVYHIIRIIFFISSNNYTDVLKESIWK